jgi:hypothetical protein
MAEFLKMDFLDVFDLDVLMIRYLDQDVKLSRIQYQELQRFLSSRFQIEGLFYHIRRKLTRGRKSGDYFKTLVTAPAPTV